MKRFGKLPPLYDFALNTYTDQRVSRCPRCDQLTHERKMPLLIHIDPMTLFVLRLTCRFCTPCQFLICHQQDLEAQLVIAMEQQGTPELIGNEYLVLGTLDMETWRAGMKGERQLMVANLTDYMHDFKHVLKLEITGGWMSAEKAKELTQDDVKGLEGRIQKVTDSFVKQVDDAVAAKEKEIISI